ncbi:hypothetical protein JCM8547_004215 [Rhodosporidiobolus lusitaniae]
MPPSTAHTPRNRNYRLSPAESQRWTNWEKLKKQRYFDLKWALDEEYETEPADDGAAHNRQLQINSLAAQLVICTFDFEIGKGVMALSKDPDAVLAWAEKYRDELKEECPVDKQLCERLSRLNTDRYGSIELFRAKEKHFCNERLLEKLEAFCNDLSRASGSQRERVLGNWIRTQGWP